jgi:MFS family permease
MVLTTFVLIERASTSAMFDLELLRNRSFVGVMICAVLMTFSAFAAFTYTSIWLQSVLGLSPIEAGLTSLPMSVMAFAISAVFGRFLHGHRAGLAIGYGLLLIGAGGVVGAVMVHGDAGWAALIPGFFVVGIGVGLATPTVGSAAMAAVPMQRGGMAGGAVNTARQLGFAFGIAALGSVFSARAGHVLTDRGVGNATELGRAVAGGRSGEIIGRDSNLSDAVHAAAVQGVQWTLGVAGCVGLIAGTLALILIRSPKGGGPGQDAPTAPAARPAPAEQVVDQPLEQPLEQPEGRPAEPRREPALVGARVAGLNGSANGTPVNGSAPGPAVNGGNGAAHVVDQRRIVGGLRPPELPPLTEWRS